MGVSGSLLIYFLDYYIIALITALTSCLNLADRNIISLHLIALIGQLSQFVLHLEDRAALLFAAEEPQLSLQLLRVCQSFNVFLEILLSFDVESSVHSQSLNQPAFE